MKRIPLLDLRAHHAPIRAAIDEAIARVVDSGRFVSGAEVEALETEIARYARVGHAVGMSSGTDALLATLMALGVGPGDEVITTPFTFLATCGAIARLGARAVFVDVDPRSFLLDIEHVERAITPKTKAIVPVHLFGQMADTETFAEITARRSIAVVADAAQAIGAELDGARAGARGAAATYSFFPSKNLGALGDGGMVVTNDGELAARLRRIRSHGQAPGRRHEAAELGGNFRLDELQAAVLRAKLPHLDAWNAARRRNAGRYRALLGAADLGDAVTLPEELPGRLHVFHHFVLRARDRDGLRAHLAARGIEAEIYYPVPMHLQECFAAWGYRRGDFPRAEAAAAEVLAIPVHPELAEREQDEVVEAIRSFYRP